MWQIRKPATAAVEEDREKTREEHRLVTIGDAGAFAKRDQETDRFSERCPVRRGIIIQLDAVLAGGNGEGQQGLEIVTVIMQRVALMKIEA